MGDANHPAVSGSLHLDNITSSKLREHAGRERV
jgi:hypothetical protein